MKKIISCFVLFAVTVMLANVYAYVNDDLEINEDGIYSNNAEIDDNSVESNNADIDANSIDAGGDDGADVDIDDDSIILGAYNSDGTDDEDIRVTNPENTYQLRNPQGQIQVEDNDELLNPEGEDRVLLQTEQGSLEYREDMLRAKFEDRNEVSIEEFDDASVEIRPNTIISGDTRIQVTGKTLMVRTADSDLQISSDEDSVTITDGDFSVSASGVVVEKNKIKVNGVEILAPSKAISAELREKSKNVEIIAEDDTAIYRVNTQVKRRLFWVISVNVEEDYDLEGSTGVVIKKRGPWWSFLAR